MRLKYKPWANEFIAQNPQIFITNPEQLQPLVTKFSNIEIEFGMGKGSFIINLAQQNPQTLFIGVEVQASAIVTAGKILEENPLDNLVLIHDNVANFVNYPLLQSNINKIYLNFSDPWPKNRHQKRRLTYQSFLNIYHDLLTADGTLQLKTDNDPLFAYSLVSLSQNNWKLLDVQLDLHRTDIFNIQTEYENKFSQRGYTIKYLVAERNKDECTTN